MRTALAEWIIKAKASTNRYLDMLKKPEPANNCIKKMLVTTKLLFKSKTNNSSTTSIF